VTLAHPDRTGTAVWPLYTAGQQHDPHDALPLVKSHDVV
jgi:hypothetical protein